ncbi:thiolase family protein [Pseudarthrobacter cellobiosi]|uniref:thiolase family protein n=1 Tax=Pseudarthrobacter cellobiosi TaxID=2953654 RepID=UPI00208E0024|nr:hypothetical protein [Pseudarthrobacter sp. HLT1-5]MCO4253727.1 hypothetical protein [Pseudarthrobacter sp. HLT1-5]
MDLHKAKRTGCTRPVTGCLSRQGQEQVAARSYQRAAAARAAGIFNAEIAPMRFRSAEARAGGGFR